MALVNFKSDANPKKGYWIVGVILSLLAFSGLVVGLTTIGDKKPSRTERDDDITPSSESYFKRDYEPTPSFRNPDTVESNGRGFCTSFPPKGRSDRRVGPSNKLKVMHFNAKFAVTQNLHDSLCDTAHDRAYCRQWRNNDAHLTNVGQLVSLYDVDIIHVCEVLDCHTLEAIRRAMPNADQYWVYYPKQRDPATFQGCGIITRIDPITDVNVISTYADGPVPGSSCEKEPPTKTGLSKGIHTVFYADDVPISFFGLHLLAQPSNADRCHEREVQAAIVAHEITGGAYASATPSNYALAEKITKKKAKDFEVIVVGDMNDYDYKISSRSEELLIAYRNSPSETNIQRVSNALGFLREGARGSMNFYSKSGKKDISVSAAVGDLKSFFKGVGLTNLMWKEPIPWNRRSFADRLNTKSSVFTVLDHFLVSPALNAAVSNFQAAATWMSVLPADEVTASKGNGWDGLKHCSDHYPLWASFDLSFAKKFSKGSTNGSPMRFKDRIDVIPEFDRHISSEVSNCSDFIKKAKSSKKLEMNSEISVQEVEVDAGAEINEIERI